MKKIKIGIPRSLYYYYYGDLLKNFFENLNCEIIISPQTTKEIMNQGIKYAYDEMCLALKNYIGHIDYLKDKCDYIVIPRIDNFGSNDQTCTNFLSTYDIVQNLFKVSIINYNIDYDHKETEELGFIKMGETLNFTKKQSRLAYEKAKIDTMNQLEKRIRKNCYQLKTDKLKILVVGHAYNIEDNYIGKPILKMLEDMGVNLIYSNLLPPEKTNRYSKKISKDLYFKYNKENIGAIEMVKRQIDGVLFFTVFPCGPDSIANELAMRKIKLPYLNLIVDDLDSLTGFETRIESFIDIIKERKKQCQK